MKILVFGGTGLVGQHLVDLLSQKGHQIDVVSRNPRKFLQEHPTIAGITGDLSDPGWLEKSSIDFNQYQVIFHLVYANQTDEQYNRQVLVQSLEQVLSHLGTLDEKKLEHFIYTGSMAVYGQNPAATEVNESTEKNGDTPYARLKIVATGLILEDNSSFLKTVIHPTGVYGPHSPRIENYRTLLRQNYIPFLTGGQGNNNIVHAKDVALALVQSLDRPPANKVEEYIINGEVIPYHEWFRILESTLSRHQTRRLPVSFKMVARGVIRKMLNAIGFSCPLNIPEYKLLLYESPVQFSSKKAQEDFNFRPQVFFKDFCKSLN